MRLAGEGRRERFHIDKIAAVRLIVLFGLMRGVGVDVIVLSPFLLWAGKHFELAARGIEVGEKGWFFSDRKWLLRELVDWLNTAEHGVS